MNYTHTSCFFIEIVYILTCIQVLTLLLNKVNIVCTSSIYPLIPTQYLSDNTHNDYDSKTNYFQDRKDL